MHCCRHGSQLQGSPSSKAERTRVFPGVQTGKKGDVDPSFVLGGNARHCTSLIYTKGRPCTCKSGSTDSHINAGEKAGTEKRPLPKRPTPNQTHEDAVSRGKCVTMAHLPGVATVSLPCVLWVLLSLSPCTVLPSLVHEQKRSTVCPVQHGGPFPRLRKTGNGARATERVNLSFYFALV